MSHAGFKSSSHLDFKLSSYRSISCFTGNLDRTTQKEGILGILFEENENFDNLDLFLQRNLYQAINKPDNQMMEAIFSDKLPYYLKLNDFLEKVEVEDILDLFIITGGDTYKSCILKIGEKQVPNSEMNDIYQKIMKAQEIPLFYYVKLDLKENDNTFLIIKAAIPNPNIYKILKSVKPYLEKFYYYSLEILTLFLFPSVIKMQPSKSGITKEILEERKSLLKRLKNSDNYGKEFNKYISNLIEGRFYIAPLLEN
jgi:hypothetical protein